MPPVRSFNFFPFSLKVILVFGFSIFLIAAERELDALAFTFSLFGLILAGLLLVSARLWFSFVVAAGLLALSAVFSMAKYKFMAMNVHIFDIWFYLVKSDTLGFLLESFFVLVAAGALALVVFFGTSFFLLRREPKMVRSPAMIGVIAAGFAAAIPLNHPDSAYRMNYHLHKSHFVSSFFVSLQDLPKLAEPGPLSKILAKHSSAPAFAANTECKTGQRPPDIILVLSESAVPQQNVPGWKYDQSLRDYFRSFDGNTYRARVETHGGGTWISAVSVMTGLSMLDLGWMRPYVTMLANGEFKDSLAMRLAACGYKTAMISPQNFLFVNEGPMMRALGIQDFLDREALAAPSKHEADEFYFRKALDYIERHRAEDGRPLFLFIETMGAHAPYTFRFKPERAAKGEPFGNGAEADEYLRRLTFAQEDYAAFTKSLETSAQARPALVAQFGDHHPAITAAAFDRAGSGDGWASPRFETFYAVTPVLFNLTRPMPAVDVLDLAYLGATLLDLAGLPPGAPAADKIALRDLCAGAFLSCPRRDAVELHLARLARSGLLFDRPATSDQTEAARTRGP